MGTCWATGSWAANYLANVSSSLDLSYLFPAIITKTVGSALASNVGGKIFLDEAEEGAAYPYVVFFVVGGSTDNRFAKHGEDTLIQFSIFSSSKSFVEVAGVYRDLIALFDDCTFTITNNTVIDMIRTGPPVTMVDEITTTEGTATVKHWAVDYRILTEAS